MTTNVISAVNAVKEADKVYSQESLIGYRQQVGQTAGAWDEVIKEESTSCH